jgi:hypothetical protein
MSYFGDEGRNQLEHMHGDFQQAQNQNLQQLVTDAVQQHLASLNVAQTPSEDVRVSFAMDDKLKHAMQYQSKVEHVGEAVRRDTHTDLPNIPLTQAALRRNAGIPSQSGSSRSQRSSDQDPSLISAGHRLTGGEEAGGVTVMGNEMKMRIDTSSGFEMEFEGRRVVLNPIGDGTTAELIIGGKPRGDTTYMSTRGSTVTKSVINRAPSQRQRRVTRDDIGEIEDDDDRTERRTVYGHRDERRRENEARLREEEELRELRELRDEKRREKLDREDREREREREREERRLLKERKELRRERDALREREALRERNKRQDGPRQRRSHYDDDFEDEDDESSDYVSEEEDRRTTRPTRPSRRPRPKISEEPRRERRRAPSSPERRHRDDGPSKYPKH